MATKSFTFQHKFPIVLQAVSFSYASRLIKCTFFFTLQHTSIDFSNWDPLKLKLGVRPFMPPFPLKCWLPAFKFRVPSRCCYAIALLMKCEYFTGPAILCHGLPSKRYQFNTSKQHIIYAKAKIHLRKLKQFKEGCVVGNVHMYHAWTLNDTVLSSFFLFFFSSSHSLCLSWSFFYPRVSRCRDLVF